jgi:transcriptional regulator with XRE-family HTH domain
VWVQQKEYKQVGAILVVARERAGLTQQQLAKRLSKPQSFVSSYERGQRRIDVLELLRIAEALEIDSRRIFREIVRRCMSKVKKHDAGRPSSRTRVTTIE